MFLCIKHVGDKALSGDNPCILAAVSSGVKTRLSVLCKNGLVESPTVNCSLIYPIHQVFERDKSILRSFSRVLRENKNLGTPL